MLHTEFSKTICLLKFLSFMKMTDDAPVYDKERQPVKNSHHLVSIFSILSKVFGKILELQV